MRIDGRREVFDGCLDRVERSRGVGVVITACETIEVIGGEVGEVRSEGRTRADTDSGSTDTVIV